MIKFSIIVPVYNVEDYLEECLNSILKQNYQNYEVIIVCDKCTDNSEKIVDNYVKKYLNFLKINAENTGLSEARNMGLQKVTGDYILFLDSDDYWEESLLQTLVENLNEKPDLLRFQVQEIIGGYVQKWSEEPFNVMSGIESFNKISKYHFIENSWMYTYKTDFWKENDFRFLPNCIAEDYGLTPLIIARAKSVKSIDYIGYNYRHRKNSLMNNDDYSKKIKKMEDMLLQSEFIKSKIRNISGTDEILRFINNSLIYFSTTLKKNDYKKYNKILKKQKCFDYLKNDDIKNKIKSFIIKRNSWFFYHKIARSK